MSLFNELKRHGVFRAGVTKVKRLLVITTIFWLNFSLPLSTALAFNVNGVVELQPVFGSEGCESNELRLFMGDVDFSDNDSGSGHDHFSVALIDGNDLVLAYSDESRPNNQSPDIVSVQASLAGITSRLVRMIVFEKHTDQVTPGSDPQQQFEHAQVQFSKPVERSTDLVSLGMQSCREVDFPQCPDPLIFLSGMETKSCRLESGTRSEFEKPLHGGELCIGTGVQPSDVGDIDYCQNSCGSGTGCPVIYSTPDRVNISEDRLCGTYHAETTIDFDNSLFGSCTVSIALEFYLDAVWDGSYSSSRTWGYVNPVLDIIGFDSDRVDDNCALVPGAILDQMLSLMSNQIESQVQQVFDEHFATMEGKAFCPVDSSHAEYIP